MPGTLWYRGTERVSSRDSLDCTLFNHFFLSASVHTVCSFEAENCESFCCCILSTGFTDCF